MASEDQTNQKGQCFCDAVRVEVTGAPLRMSYSHYTDCRAWAAA
ncbi:MAG: hypothetical protein OSB69_14960 [Alphaproteobacteria bacterium]|nr:hypothetical protein [Alphaproteobacteria bacterium]